MRVMADETYTTVQQSTLSHSAAERTFLRSQVEALTKRIADLEAEVVSQSEINEAMYRQQTRIAELEAALQASTGGTMSAPEQRRVKMYAWWKPAWFLAVAQARSVSEARQLLLKGELGDSGDGSCPERDRARQLILEETPSIWIGANAEFMLNVNAELREQEDYSEKLFRENAQLRAELREALLEIAGTPPEALWEMEEPCLDYVTIRVHKKDYASAQRRLTELEERTRGGKA